MCLGDTGHVAVGDIRGAVSVWDLQRLDAPTFAVSDAHGDQMVNAVATAGPEVASGGGDGAARVWDVRQPQRPVLAWQCKASQVWKADS